MVKHVSIIIPPIKKLGKERKALERSGAFFYVRKRQMKILIVNESKLSLEHIGYILDNMHAIRSHLDETIMYQTNTGLAIAVVISKIEHEDYTEWIFRSADN